MSNSESRIFIRKNFYIFTFEISNVSNKIYNNLFLFFLFVKLFIIYYLSFFIFSPFQLNSVAQLTNNDNNSNKQNLIIEIKPLFKLISYFINGFHYFDYISNPLIFIKIFFTFSIFKLLVLIFNLVNFNFLLKLKKLLNTFISYYLITFDNVFFFPFLINSLYIIVNINFTSELLLENVIIEYILSYIAIIIEIIYRVIYYLFINLPYYDSNTYHYHHKIKFLLLDFISFLIIIKYVIPVKNDDFSQIIIFLQLSLFVILLIFQVKENFYFSQKSFFYMINFFAGLYLFTSISNIFIFYFNIVLNVTILIYFIIFSVFISFSYIFLILYIKYKFKYQSSYILNKEDISNSNPLQYLSEEQYHNKLSFIINSTYDFENSHSSRSFLINSLREDLKIKSSHKKNCNCLINFDLLMQINQYYTTYNNIDYESISLLIDQSNENQYLKDNHGVTVIEEYNSEVLNTSNEKVSERSSNNKEDITSPVKKSESKKYKLSFNNMPKSKGIIEMIVTQAITNVPDSDKNQNIIKSNQNIDKKKIEDYSKEIEFKLNSEIKKVIDNTSIKIENTEFNINSIIKHSLYSILLCWLEDICRHYTKSNYLKLIYSNLIIKFSGTYQKGLIEVMKILNNQKATFFEKYYAYKLKEGFEEIIQENAIESKSNVLDTEKILKYNEYIENINNILILTTENASLFWKCIKDNKTEGFYNVFDKAVRINQSIEDIILKINYLFSDSENVPSLKLVNKLRLFLNISSNMKITNVENQLKKQVLSNISDSKSSHKKSMEKSDFKANKIMNSGRYEEIEYDIKNIFQDYEKLGIITVSNTNDSIGRIEFCNKQIANLLNYDKKDIINASLKKIIVNYVSDLHDFFLKKYIETNKSYHLNNHIVLLLKTRNQFIIPVHFILKIIPNFKNGVKIIAVIRQFSQNEPLLKIHYNKYILEYDVLKTIAEGNLNTQNTIDNNVRNKTKSKFNMKSISLIPNCTTSGFLATTNEPDFFLIGISKELCFDYGIPLSSIYETQNYSNTLKLSDIIINKDILKNLKPFELLNPLEEIKESEGQIVQIDTSFLKNNFQDYIEIVNREQIEDFESKKINFENGHLNKIHYVHMSYFPIYYNNGKSKFCIFRFVSLKQKQDLTKSINSILKNDNLQVNQIQMLSLNNKSEKFELTQGSISSKQGNNEIHQKHSLKLTKCISNNNVIGSSLKNETYISPSEFTKIINIKFLKSVNRKLTLIIKFFIFIFSFLILIYILEIVLKYEFLDQIKNFNSILMLSNIEYQIYSSISLLYSYNFYLLFDLSLLNKQISSNINFTLLEYISKKTNLNLDYYNQVSIMKKENITSSFIYKDVFNFNQISEFIYFYSNISKSISNKEMYNQYINLNQSHKVIYDYAHINYLISKYPLMINIDINQLITKNNQLEDIILFQENYNRYIIPLMERNSKYTIDESIDTFYPKVLIIICQYLPFGICFFSYIFIYLFFNSIFINKKYIVNLSLLINKKEIDIIMKFISKYIVFLREDGNLSQIKDKLSDEDMNYFDMLNHQQVLEMKKKGNSNMSFNNKDKDKMDSNTQSLYKKNAKSENINCSHQLQNQLQRKSFLRKTTKIEGQNIIRQQNTNIISKDRLYINSKRMRKSIGSEDESAIGLKQRMNEEKNANQIDEKEMEKNEITEESENKFNELFFEKLMTIDNTIITNSNTQITLIYCIIHFVVIILIFVTFYVVINILSDQFMSKTRNISPEYYWNRLQGINNLFYFGLLINMKNETCRLKKVDFQNESLHGYSYCEYYNYFYNKISFIENSIYKKEGLENKLYDNIKNLLDIFNNKSLFCERYFNNSDLYKPQDDQILNKDMEFSLNFTNCNDFYSKYNDLTLVDNGLYDQIRNLIKYLENVNGLIFKNQSNGEEININNITNYYLIMLNNYISPSIYYINLNLFDSINNLFISEKNTLFIWVFIYFTFKIFQFLMVIWVYFRIKINLINDMSIIDLLPYNNDDEFRGKLIEVIDDL